MAQDRWFRLVEDNLDDIPARVEKLKASYIQRFIIFFALIALGTLMMLTSGDNSMVGIGVFVSVTGVSGIMSISIMYHAQLCLYRNIIEMRALKD